MNLLSETQISDIVVALLSAAILALAGALWEIILKNPYNSYTLICKKILKIIKDFKDPRQV